MNVIRRLLLVFSNVSDIKGQIPKCTNCKALYVFFDKRKWITKYRLMEQEYFQFEFYNLTTKEKMEYVRDYEIMHNTFNSLEERKLLDNKVEFNQLFSDLIGRDYLCINKDSYKEFLMFIEKHPIFIKKPIDQYGGSGVCKIDSRVMDKEILFNKITQNGSCLIEEILIQHEKMALLNPDSVNTIRVVIMRDKDGEIHVPFANIRIGRKGKIVDNFCAGGMSAGIDMKKGTINSEAFDKNCVKYTVHPDSDVELIGFSIPHWNGVIALAKEAAKKIPNCHYIGWDIMIREDGEICLIEGNGRPAANVHQLAAHKGLRSIYKKYLEEF